MYTRLMTAHLKLVAVSLLAALMLAGTSLLAFRQEVTLRYRWNKGETLRYRITQHTASNISGLPGMGDITVEQTISQVFRSSTENVAQNGSTTLQQVIESAKVDFNTPMGKLAYDSANPSAAPDPQTKMLQATFSAMIGEPVTVIMDSTGTVEKVEGFTRLVEKMFKTLPQDPASAAGLNALKTSLSDDAMRNMLGQGFAVLPARPIKPGDTWNSQLTNTNPMVGKMTTTITSTLKAIEGAGDNQVARVAMKLAITQDGAGAMPNPMGLVTKVGESTGEGELTFDLGKGRLQRSSLHTLLPMTMTGNGPDGSPVTMQSNAKTTVSMELIEK
jgi:Family of unknown function (DUF6263)